MAHPPRSIPPAAMTGRRPMLVASLLAAGVLVWLAIGGGRGIGALRWAIIAAAAALAALPGPSHVIVRGLDRLRRPSPPRRRLIAVAVAVVSAAYFILTAFLQDRDLFPKTHDDSSYLIQMQMLAHGRLWMPPHPLADFFDSFYLIVRPVYASQYFPGTALMYVPTIWLHLPTWVLPVLAAGGTVGLVYRILSELIDGAAGAMVALWVASLTWFRMASILLMSQVPAMLLGLVMVWAWLRWRAAGRSASRGGWMLLIGVAAGWAAITRPVDALCYALPVGAAIALDLLGSRARRWAVVVALFAIGAAPFLALQLAFDKGVTGHWFRTPFQMYLDRDAPGTQFGFPKYDPAARPQSVLPQKREYYQDWVVPFIRGHHPDQVLQAWVTRWLPMIVDTTMPTRLMIPLAFAGLAGLTDQRRRVLWATLPLFVGLYFCYTIFLEHYAIAVIPAVVMCALLGANAVADSFPKLRMTITAVITAAIVASCVTAFWEVNRWIAPPGRQVADETFASPMLRELHDVLPYASDLKRPAVILFRHHPGDNYFEEPVYNTSAAWPDDAEIIRAHDLGPQRDREIVNYYGSQRPPREFYLFDAKAANAFEDLGPSDDPARVSRNLDRIAPGRGGNHDGSK